MKTGIKKLRLEHFFLAALVILTVWAITFSWLSPFSKAIRNGDRINGILIGTDWVDYARHSDTLIFVSYDPSKRFLDVISIPRDTHFSPEGYSFRRINEVYAYHYRTKKSDKAACHEVKYAVEQLFQNRAVIPYYVRVDYGSFKKFIDLIGGIDIDIEEPMHYDDSWGKLHIHFEPGHYHLNGQKSLEYVRYRGAAGDIGRVFRQQRFMKSVFAKLKSPYNLLRLPYIVKQITSDIDTNLSIWDIFAGMIELKDLKPQNIRFAQLPGYPKKQYWQVDIDNTEGLINKIIPSTATFTAQGPKVKIEVWNASGKTGLAEEVSWILRKQGFDVIDWGTFSVRQKKTLVKDLRGDIRSAQRITDILACGEVVTRFDEKKLVSISVILGEDCIAISDKKEEEK